VRFAFEEQATVFHENAICVFNFTVQLVFEPVFVVLINHEFLVILELGQSVLTELELLLVPYVEYILH
jgi:hypothetical protein